MSDFEQVEYLLSLVEKAEEKHPHLRAKIRFFSKHTPGNSHTEEVIWDCLEYQLRNCLEKAARYDALVSLGRDIVREI